MVQLISFILCKDNSVSLDGGRGLCVFVTSRKIINYSKTSWPKTAVLSAHDSVGQQFGLGSAEQFIC